MTQPYRLHEPGGVIIEATGQIIYPGDYPEWQDYEAWLATLPPPDITSGTLPAGTGLLPYIAPTMTLAEQRAEAQARLAAIVATRRHSGTVNAVGHAWALSWPFVLAVLVHRAAMPPMVAGFTLPDANRVQVPLTLPQFSQLVEAMSARLILLNNNHAALVALIDASAAPLTINLELGWPP